MSTLRSPAAARRVDLGLAAALAVSPLLPSGPRYLGLGHNDYALLGTVGLVAAWSVLRATRYGLAPPRGEDRGARAIAWTWGALVAATGGATLLGVASVASIRPVGWAEVAELPLLAFQPIPRGVHPLHPVGRWLAFLQGAATFLVVWDLCRRGVDPQARARRALGGWVLGYTAVALFALVQYVTQWQLHPYWVRINPALVRSHSTFDDPNALGAYLVLGLGLVAALAWLGRRMDPSARAVARVALVAGLLALLATVSRKSWVAAAVVAPCLLGVGPLRWWGDVPRLVGPLRRAIRVAAVVGGLVVVTAVASRLVVAPEVRAFRPTTPLAAVVDTLDPRVPLSSVLSFRFQWWEAAIRMYVDHPVVGVGLARYPRRLPEYSPGTPAQNAHSFWLQVPAETGTVGLAAFVLLLASIGSTLGGHVQRGDIDRSLVAGGCLAGLAALLVTCLAGHPLWLGSMHVALGSLVALGVVVSTPSPDEASARALRGWRRVAITVAVVSAVLYPLAAWTR